MAKINQWVIVGIVALVALIVVILLVSLNRRKRPQPLYSTSSTTSHRESVQTAPPPVKVAIPPSVQTAPPPEPPKPEVKAPSLPPAPVLRCYDYFEFPQEGGFQVKTCSAPQREGQSIPSHAPKRIFLQWFPVENSKEYRIYANAGNDVDVQNFKKKWSVKGSSHYFESEELVEPVCWSVIVTSVNAADVESLPSVIYSTCQQS